MNKKQNRGISLIVLVITIIVVIIIAGAIILSITNGGVLDSAKKARFMSDFRNVEEGVSLYSLNDMVNSTNTNNPKLPVEGDKLTFTEKDDIFLNVPTLKEKIEELNPGQTIYDRDLYWIKESDIGVNLSPEKREKGYLIDSQTKQIYDYSGDVFSKLRWHTLDAGVDEASVVREPATDELWNGWIKLTLYYPASSTEKKWRLGSEGELRADSMLMWQNYTGPITIPLDRTKDVWIKYKVNNKEITVPPAGTLLVDIIPDKTGSTKVEQVNVNINYDETATTKEYRIGDSGWLTYTGPFTVTENCIIEARAKKTENIYNTDGSLLLSRDVVGSDMVYIGNIGSETKNNLPAPTITRIVAQNLEEKARVQITYPVGADKKIYTIDFGIETDYTSDISITNWGKTIVAYYYDSNGNKSEISRMYIGETPTSQESDNVKVPIIEPAPTMIRLDSQNADEKARVKIEYPANASRKIYKINYGIEQTYTEDISIKVWGTNVIAYYYDVDGNMSKITSLTINDTSVEPAQEPKPLEPLPPYEPGTPLPPTTIDIEVNLVAPTITRLAPQDSTEKARVNVVYPGTAVRKVFTVNSGAEIEYTGNIKINGWNTTIKAYYYDAKGNKSKLAQIFIGEEPTLPTELPIYEPKSVVAAPVIDISPNSGIVNQVTVSVNPPVAADKIYLKVGEYADYKEYTGPVTVKENTEIYAYYRISTGEKSLTAQAKITNIKQGNKPYLNIDANPYPWSNSKGASAVTIILNTSDANKVEYSEDGVVYKNYTVPFVVIENKRIYARATNTYGVTESYLDITNIGAGQSIPTEPIQKLGVNINANPDPAISQTRVAKVVISIEYDQRATEKYYSIGKNSELKSYTAPFEVTDNCTIYAYALGTNAKGEVTKVIDNILTGVSEPIISTTPVSSVIASKVTVNIQYDKYATVKKYSINDGALQDYTGEFEVIENATRIYAYSENAASQKSEANYTIQNIISQPPVLLLDKGSYYLLKLSYPPDSKSREYKWKENGEWKTYNEDGLLLIKPQYKDTVIKNGTLIKIEDENGNQIDFKGEYYLIDVPIRELFENISMRWDRVPPKAPQILINTTEPAKSVIATVVYEIGLIKKQYRILETGGTLGDWQYYTDPITITKNNTIIYAKGMDDSEVWSAEGAYKIINIDEVAPVINLTADITTIKPEVPVTVNVTDDIEVAKVKWAAGIQGENYFTNAGTEIQNNSILNIAENGYYTFYAEDKVGNMQVYTLNVENIDKTAPENPLILANLTTWTNSDVVVTITYPSDAAIKEYSTNGTNWSNYTAPIIVTVNNTTIYARAKDEAGNQSGQSTLTITNIDKTIPAVTYGTNGANNVSIASTLVTVSDIGGSEININELQYIWDTQNIVVPSTGWTSLTNATTLTKTGEEGQVFYLWIKASDNAGNLITTKSAVFTLVEANIVSTPNKPLLNTGMTARKWNADTSTWDIVSDPDNDTTWYDYNTGKWANAQTSDGSMWVWIPRYIYKIRSGWHESTAGKISIVFSQGTNDTWNSEITLNTSGSASASNGTFTNQPGFTFGSTQVTGLWIAKFEATAREGLSNTLAGDNNVSKHVKIIPGTKSWRYAYIGTMFTVCRNMESDSSYGWGTSGVGIDTHQMKNNEWGAVAYLAYSSYGNNGTKILLNNSASCYTGGNLGNAYISNIEQSTTKNIYGIYDMSGGAYEYTSAYLNIGTNTNVTLYGSSMQAQGKYVDGVYAPSPGGNTQSGVYSLLVNYKGNALYETSSSYNALTSWFGEQSSTPYGNSAPFFTRGGSYGIGSQAGLFGFSFYYGYQSSDISFRPVLMVETSL